MKLPQTPGESVFDKDFLNRARGCLMGQFCGDAFGSQVEFYPASQIKKMYPDGLSEMRDGGRWNSVAGQPTDDSEMALMLTHSLVANGKYDPRATLGNYIHWMDSGPMDIGNTTGQALSAAKIAIQSGNSNFAEMIKLASDPNSEANGALMRVSPIGIFGHASNVDDVVEWAKADAQLTHVNKVCHDANAVYIVALHTALNTGDAHRTYQKVIDWMQENQVGKSVQDTIYLAAKEEPGEFQRQMGWVLIALQNAFYHLVNTTSAKEAIIKTAMNGGDADTNAAIVGALMGAVYGIDSIPEQWVNAVLNCRPDRGNPKVKKPRPKEFWPIDALILVDKLLAAGSMFAFEMEKDKQE